MLPNRSFSCRDTTLIRRFMTLALGPNQPALCILRESLTRSNLLIRSANIQTQTVMARHNRACLGHSRAASLALQIFHGCSARRLHEAGHDDRGDAAPSESSAK